VPLADLDVVGPCSLWCPTGRRVYATVTAAGVAVTGYVLNTIGNQSKALDSLRNLYPHGWTCHHRPLASGADWVGHGLLRGRIILFVIDAVIAFRRRDITDWPTIGDCPRIRDNVNMLRNRQPEFRKPSVLRDIRVSVVKLPADGHSGWDGKLCASPGMGVITVV
jgi:hypothetical protein